MIVMRKDLNMRKGKMVAQGAHASVNAILNGKEVVTDVGRGTTEIRLNITEGTPLREWIDGRYTKICVSVNSEEELDKVKAACDEAGIPNALVIDAGLTEFHGIPTKTCLGIGPWYTEEIDKITGTLSLL